MVCNQLTKQSGSALHDSQVHVYDAVGYPVYVKNRNARILKSTDMGGAIQRSKLLLVVSSQNSKSQTHSNLFSLSMYNLQPIIGLPYQRK